MKNTLFIAACLLAASAAGLSFGDDNTPGTGTYTVTETITYDGNSGSTLATTGSGSVYIGSASGYTGTWTMAFTISGLAVTSDSDVGILLTYNSSSYYNLEGIGYQLSSDGSLTLCVGGYNYNGGSAYSSWKTQTVSSGYSADTPITIFYVYSSGTVTVYSMLGSDSSTLTALTSLAGSSVQFSKETVTQINFSAKDSSGSTWSVPDGVTGSYTLYNFDLYTDTALTTDQMQAYAVAAVGAIPEPAAASLSLLGFCALLLRRRRA